MVWRRNGAVLLHDYAGVNADVYSMVKCRGNGFPVAGFAITLEFDQQVYEQNKKYVYSKIAEMASNGEIIP